MKILANSKQLIVQLEGLEKFWGFRKSLIIPREKITSIKWYDRYENLKGIWRVCGTGAPGLLFAGYFRANGKWIYMYLKKPHGFFNAWAESILEIESKDFKYGKVLLTYSNIQSLRLEEWQKGSLDNVSD